jgi:hypothetical protein
MGRLDLCRAWPGWLWWCSFLFFPSAQCGTAAAIRSGTIRMRVEVACEAAQYPPYPCTIAAPPPLRLLGAYRQRRVRWAWAEALCSSRCNCFFPIFISVEAFCVKETVNRQFADFDKFLARAFVEDMENPNGT